MRITPFLMSLLFVSACGGAETAPGSTAGAESNVPIEAAPETASAIVLSDQAQQGRDVFEYWCATCHGPGPHKAGTMALGFKYDGELPASLLKRTDVDEMFLTYFVRNGVSVMPSFRPTEVSDSDIAAMAAYIQATSKAPD